MRIVHNALETNCGLDFMTDCCMFDSVRENLMYSEVGVKRNHYIQEVNSSFRMVRANGERGSAHGLFVLAAADWYLEVMRATDPLKLICLRV